MAQSPLNVTTQPGDSEEEGRSSTIKMHEQWLKKNLAEGNSEEDWKVPTKTALSSTEDGAMLISS